MLRQLRDGLGMISRGPRSVLIEHLEMNIAALTVVAYQMRRPMEDEDLRIPLGCGTKPPPS
eukprot:6422222-Heterocapsa_arctica.AAC.1